MSWLNRTFGAGRSRVVATLGTAVALRRVALASLVANVVIVVTGGAVRLTGSGLGCPTWPKCDGSSYVTTSAMGYHGVIEFTNRTLTGAVEILAVLCLIAAWAQPRVNGATARRGIQLRWAVIVMASIPAQAVLGGITVLTKLNPWAVASHFLLSIAVIAAAYRLWIHSRTATVATAPAAPAIRTLAQVIVGVTALVLAAGTVVTGSGPHAGDAKAKRTGLDPAMIAQLHTDLVMLLIGLSVAAWLALRATGTARALRATGIPAPRADGTLAGAARAALNLIVIECAQAFIGFVQYFTHLPVILVGAHMLGACLVWLGVLTLLTAVGPAAATAPAGTMAVDDIVTAVPAARTGAEV